MRAYIYLINGKIHSVEDVIFIQHDYLNEVTIFHARPLGGSVKSAGMKYFDKDIINISVQI